MRNVYITADNIFSPLGTTSAENFAQLSKMVTAVKEHTIEAISPVPFHASLFDQSTSFSQIGLFNQFTKFEKLMIASMRDALHNSKVDPADKKNILIVSTTKGNISMLETETMNGDVASRMALTTSAKLVAGYFKFHHQPIVVSNACISGLLAMITGMRLIQSGQYENVVITGADLISKFILSGFQSFQAVSAEPCKPFDADRKGINLGEGAATIILSANDHIGLGMRISGGAVSNDANHISGPSRTGEELYQAIGRALSGAGLTGSDIDYISAHGTATIYNDEMEAKAINLANLQNVPVNSLKGYYGHTLGAAGIIESVIAIHSMVNETLIPTLGFSAMGVSMPLNVCNAIQKRPIRNTLKTASGFGGCNAALVLSKE